MPMTMALTLGLTQGRNSASPFAGGRSGFLHDFSDLTRLFQLSGGTTAVAADGDVVGYAKSTDPTERIATQTSSSRPAWKSDGSLLFDGVNDNLITTYGPVASGNTQMGKWKVPASIAATQIIMGASSAMGSFYLAQTTAGVLAGGVGSQNTTTIKDAANTDLRGMTVVGALVEDGTTVKLYLNSVEVYSAPIVGAIPTDQVLRIGCRSNGGSPATFFADRIYRAFAIDKALSAVEVAARSAAWA